jgi:ketosteroid isomerase-like protein
LVRALFQAFAARDVEAATALAHPELEFWPQGTAHAGGRVDPYRGIDGMRAYFDDVARLWRHLEVHPGELRSVAGAVVAFGSARGTRHDGTEVDLPVIWTFKVRDGRVLSGRVVATAAEAHQVLADAASG